MNLQHLTRRATALLATLAAVLVCVVGLAGRASATTTTPTTWYVSRDAVTNPACAAASAGNPFATIPAALTCAHANDTVQVSAGQFTAPLTLARKVVLRGSGAATVLAPIGGPAITVSNGIAATVRDLTINAGYQQDGIHAGTGSLTVDGVDFEEIMNYAIQATTGTPKVTVVNSTFTNAVSRASVWVSSGNPATPATLTVANSTFDASGEYSVHAQFTTTRILNVTSSGQGQDLWLVGGTNTLSNDILDSYAACSASAGAVVASDHVLATNEPSTDCGLLNHTHGDVIGADPGLQALADNGGPTETMALAATSPAIAAGNTATCHAAPMSNKDQRGVARASVTRSACDIGAYDTSTAHTTWYVGAKSTAEPTCATASSTRKFATVYAALGCAANGDTVVVGAGRYNAPLTITTNIVLRGAGAGTVLAPSGTAQSAITIADGVTAVVRLLSIDGSYDNGGIVAGNGQLLVDKVSMTRVVDSPTTHFDAVSAIPATGNPVVTVQNSTFAGELGSGTVGVEGSGLGLAGLTVANSTFDGAEGSSVFAANATARILNVTSTGQIQDLEFTNSAVTLSNDILDSRGACEVSGGNSTVAADHVLVTTTAANTPCPIADGVNGNRVGADPGLQVLAGNGGPTQTMALAAGSPARSTGNTTTCTQPAVGGHDQRGVARNTATRAACDIGAWDSGS